MRATHSVLSTQHEHVGAIEVMTRSTGTLVAAVVGAMVAAGCAGAASGPPHLDPIDGGHDASIDQGASQNDGSMPTDSSMMDGASADTGAANDAATDASTDAGETLDASGDVDAGVAMDADVDSAGDDDAGFEMDAGSIPDAGADFAIDAVFSADAGPTTTWHVEAHPEPTAGPAGPCSSIAIDAAGHPHIAYYSSYEMELRYSRWDGAAWNSVVVDTTHDVGASCALKLDASGYAHIAYLDDTSGDLKYAEWTGSAWVKEVVDSTDDVGYSVSMALDAAGNSHVSYYDYTHGDLKYAHRVGGVWSVQTVDSADDVGGYSSIAVDSASHPHIAYLYDEGPVGDLRYASWNGSAWIIETIDSSGGTSPSLALDAAGRAQVSYVAIYGVWNKQIKFARQTAMGWDIVAFGSADNSRGATTSMALDAAGNAHFCDYYHDRNGLETRHWTGTDWLSDFVDGPIGASHTPDVGMNCSLALDSAGREHISYYDSTNFALKYAHQ